MVKSKLIVNLLVFVLGFVFALTSRSHSCTDCRARTISPLLSCFSLDFSWYLFIKHYAAIAKGFPMLFLASWPRVWGWECRSSRCGKPRYVPDHIGSDHHV